MTTTTKTRKQTEIQSATVNRVIDKATKKVLGYLVKSDSEQGVWYQVTWNREEHRYECTCPATKPCKHERAVSEVVKARKEIEAEKQETSQVATEAEKPAPTAGVETPTSVAPAPKPVAVATKQVISKATSPLRGSVGIGFPQRKDTPAPRKLAAIPMR